MDIRMQSRALLLMYSLFLRGSTNAHRIPYIPAKTEIPERSAGDTRPVTPEAVGIPSGTVRELLRTLERDRGSVVHAIGMARAGNVFSLAAAPAYRTDIRHQTHSLCKTVTGLSVGMLWDEGKIDLDAPAYRLVGQGLPPILTPRMRAVTVRHLLCMTSGVNFGEIGSVTEEDWVRCFFESNVAFAPGSSFFYNSMNSYILSVIVERITGMTLHDFAAERIFKPLGIRPTLWETCPRGHTKGGWGLYLSIEDMLKLGELIAGGGDFRGTRLLSREWMRMMVKPHAKTPEGIGPYDYGFHVWVGRQNRTVLANGMLGQNIWIHPRNHLVIAVNAGNCELFQTGSMLDSFERLMTVPFERTSLRRNTRAANLLRAQEFTFFRSRTWTHPQKADVPWWDGTLPAEKWKQLEGRPYLARKNNLGILPLFVMLMQNNLAAGISSLTFSTEEGVHILTVTEGEERYRLPIGFGEYTESVLTVRGEKYAVAARGEFCDDTDGEPILKIDLIFPEMASARRLRLYYDTEKPSLVLSEQPGRQMLDPLISLLEFTPRGKLLGGILRPQVEKELIAYRIRTCYEPTLRLGRGTPPAADESSLLDGDPLDLLDEGTDLAEPAAVPKKRTPSSKKPTAPKKKRTSLKKE